MSPLEIMLKYPRRNEVWSYDVLTGRWITEAFELGNEGKNLDPWNRPIPPVHREMRSERDDLIGWLYESSVEQSLVELVVYND